MEGEDNSEYSGDDLDLVDEFPEESDEVDLSEGEEADEEEEGSDGVEEDEGSENEGKDGMAEMMAKILGQRVDPGRVPVLSKRKTPMMREMEGLNQGKEDKKRSKLEKQALKDMHMVLPDPLTADYERGLKRLATKGGKTVFLECPSYFVCHF